MAARILVNVVQERVRTVEGRAVLNRLVKLAAPPALPLSPGAAPILEAVNRDGFCYLPAIASVDDLRALRAQLEARPCFDPWNIDLPDFSLTDTPDLTNNARIRNVSNLPAAVQLANNPLVLSVVSQYFGCRPTIDDIVAWWSIPGRPAPKEEQFFHRDNDAVRFLKLFVYLSDVDDFEGAHEFVRGSHSENRLLARRVRYQDQEVAEAFGAERILKMTGSFGTAFLEDTFGLHKGAVPQSRPRLLLQVRYSSYPSNFARKGAVSHADARYDPYINRLIC